MRPLIVTGDSPRSPFRLTSFAEGILDAVATRLERGRPGHGDPQGAVTRFPPISASRAARSKSGRQSCASCRRRSSILFASCFRCSAARRPICMSRTTRGSADVPSRLRSRSTASSVSRASQTASMISCRRSWLAEHSDLAPECADRGRQPHRVAEMADGARDDPDRQGNRSKYFLRAGMAWMISSSPFSKIRTTVSRSRVEVSKPRRSSRLGGPSSSRGSIHSDHPAAGLHPPK